MIERGDGGGGGKIGGGDRIRNEKNEQGKPIIIDWPVFVYGYVKWA